MSDDSGPWYCAKREIKILWLGTIKGNISADQDYIINRPVHEKIAQLEESISDWIQNQCFDGTICMDNLLESLGIMGKKRYYHAVDQIGARATKHKNRYGSESWKTTDEDRKTIYGLEDRAKEEIAQFKSLVAAANEHYFRVDRLMNINTKEWGNTVEVSFIAPIWVHKILDTMRYMEYAQETFKEIGIVKISIELAPRVDDVIFTGAAQCCDTCGLPRRQFSVIYFSK